MNGSIFQSRLLDEATAARRASSTRMQEELHAAQMLAAQVPVLEQENARLRSELELASCKAAQGVDSDVITREVGAVREQVRRSELLMGAVDGLMLTFGFDHALVAVEGRPAGQQAVTGGDCSATIPRKDG